MLTHTYSIRDLLSSYNQYRTEKSIPASPSLSSHILPIAASILRGPKRLPRTTSIIICCKFRALQTAMGNMYSIRGAASGSKCTKKLPLLSVSATSLLSTTYESRLTTHLSLRPFKIQVNIWPLPLTSISPRGSKTN